jgi:hypothetical protein
MVVLKYMIAGRFKDLRNGAVVSAIDDLPPDSDPAL